MSARYPKPGEILDGRRVTVRAALVALPLCCGAWPTLAVGFTMRTASVADAHVVEHFARLADADTTTPPAARPNVGRAHVSPFLQLGPRPSTMSGDGTASPKPASSFTALRQRRRAEVHPPDTHGAVGPSHLMIALNSEVAVQSRTGRTLKTVSLAAFWQRTGATYVTDPRVLYDPCGRRWILTTAAGFVGAGIVPSSVLIAVSRTRNPLRGWDLYRVDVDPDGQVSADFPQVGFNGRWIVVQTLLASGGSLIPEQIVFAFEKADLYQGGPGKFTAFHVEGDPSPITPVISCDPMLEPMYLARSSASELHLYAVTGPVGTEKLTLERVLVLPDTLFLSGRNLAPQRDSPARIAVDGPEYLSAVYRNGALWAVHTVFEDGPRSSIQWWRLDASAGAILDGGLIDDPTGDRFYAYPSIAVNRFDDVLIGYSRFSASEYASAAYSLRLGTDAPGRFREGRIMKSGEGPYVSGGVFSQNRWGDYSATVVDPRNERDLWTIQEYAESGNRWGTWWARIVPRR